MAKRQSFADKAAKKAHVRLCPVCNTPIKPVKYVHAVKTETGHKYRTERLGVCKCNHSAVYG